MWNVFNALSDDKVTDSIGKQNCIWKFKEVVSSHTQTYGVHRCLTPSHVKVQ